jgi:hypothetical protein
MINHRCGLLGSRLRSTSQAYLPVPLESDGGSKTSSYAWPIRKRHCGCGSCRDTKGKIMNEFAHDRPEPTGNSFVCTGLSVDPRMQTLTLNQATVVSSVDASVRV